MKILLLNPPRWHEIVGKNPSIIEKHRGYNPPLGLLYLASTIQKYSSYQVQVLDCQPKEWEYNELREFLENKSFDVVGIPTMTFTLIDVFKTVQLVKSIWPKAIVVLGGPHIHLFPNETINLPGVDFAIMGEAEFSFLKLLKYLEKQEKLLEKVPGLVYKNKEGKIFVNKFEPIVDLDKVPFPKREMLNIKSYTSLLSRGSVCTSIISSRGCPFKCSFCDRPLSPVTSYFRFRSPKNVVDEICYCLEYGIKDFLFYDDTFTVNRTRVIKICEEILNRDIKIRWDIRTRVDLVDEDMLFMLKKAGCVAIHYGVEAGNDRILKIIKKGFTIKKVKEIFSLTRKVGFNILAYFMIGLPSETKEDIQDTFDLAKELTPDYVHFTIFSPYPGTELYYKGLDRGVIKTDIWREFARYPCEGFKVPVWEENFTREELYKFIVKFYKRFYLCPAYLFSQIRKLNSFNEFKKKVKAGVSVLTMRKDSVDKLR